MDPPENPVELPGVAQSENEVDDNVVLPLLPSDYASYDEYDENYENIKTSIQQRQRVIHPKDIPPTMRNV